LELWFTKELDIGSAVRMFDEEHSAIAMLDCMTSMTVEFGLVCSIVAARPEHVEIYNSPLSEVGVLDLSTVTVLIARTDL
jgi:hypothetical protein